ncbi:nlpa lipoprotein [Bacillus sp. OxB-1]|uniref:MetQ/NlpA family ABC transporter substrate-binding protein n=1 Tax=Bacillus sp. (strain OxB-1) TaxID=98228 RepID=UPI000581B892|nr:MetQ/NlpA family ABC transporter substrate-binding protein [Bacillus sp. OxB-1]BAQ11858.1 nlpa lipoprotein [Bacillus sp. OxB-1]
MKKVLLTLFAVVLAAALAACGGKEKAENADDSAATEESKTLKFGATAGPYSDMLKKAIIPGLEEKGYKVEVTEFSDYIQPNNALNSGDIDANLFQHIVYLENFAQENNMDLTDLIVVPTAPLGIYSNKYKSLDEIEDGASITIPNDPVNAARTLIVLEANGLVKMNPDVEPLKASEKDVVENPKNLVIQPLEAGQLPRSVDSADLAAVPGNFAIAANMNLLDALALEEMPDQFRNVVAVKTENQDKQFAKDIIEVIESDKFEEVIDSDFQGFGKPAWMQE